MSVWVELDNRSGELKEGMLARLAIVPRPRIQETAGTLHPKSQPHPPHEGASP